MKSLDGSAKLLAELFELVLPFQSFMDMQRDLVKDFDELGGMVNEDSATFHLVLFCFLSTGVWKAS